MTDTPLTDAELAELERLCTEAEGTDATAWNAQCALMNRAPCALPRLLAEVRRLRAVVEQLPETADGVTIAPCMELFDPVHGELHVEDLRATTRDSIPETVRYLGSSCSTRAAAEAARAGKEAPDEA